jgi:hypothetical protein
LRNGGLGKYGRTYKLSTQEVCYWIREHIKPIKQDRLWKKKNMQTVLGIKCINGYTVNKKWTFSRIRQC